MNWTVIGIGNRFLSGDAAGILVYQELQQRILPDNVSLVEGGLMGLDLLPFLERGGGVIFVDVVSGFASESSIIVLNQEQILCDIHEAYSHNTGLSYLLGVLPKVYEGELPEQILLIGIEGPLTPQLVIDAANRVLAIVSEDVGTCQRNSI